MAIQLDIPSEEFKQRKRYPYESWFNGQVWELTQGEDFTCTHSSMRVTLYTKASALGGHVIVRKVENKLRIQFVLGQSTNSTVPVRESKSSDSKKPKQKAKPSKTK